MRLFIAITLPRHLKHFLDDYMHAHTQLCVRWVEKSTLHITVQFLGRVSDTRLEELQLCLQNIARTTHPFQLSFKSMIYGPPARKQKSMIWALFSENEAYAKLVEKTSSALHDFVPIEKHGTKIMRKERIPHITLARFRDGHIADQRLDMQLPENGMCDVRSIELWQSQLTPKGPQYMSLATFPLTL